MNQNEIHLSDFSVRCLVKFLVKHLWMILAGVLIFAMTASIYVNLLYTPRYKATTTYTVTSRKTSYTSSTNISSATEVTSVLTEMLGTDMALKSIQESNPKLLDFSGSLSATQVGSSNFIVVSVTDSSPEVAFLAMQAVADILPNYTDYVSSDCIVQVIRNPAVSSAPINSVDDDLTRNAAIIGGVVMVALLCWFFTHQETIQTRSGARHLLSAHIITTVYKEDRRKGLKNKFRRGPKVPLQVFSPTATFAYTEQINAICAQMEHEAAAEGSKIFLFTGVSENEGKTTIAGNVAAALSMMGKRVALLDCDLRNPSMNTFFDGKYASNMPLNQLLSRPLTKETLFACMQRHDRLGLFMLFPMGSDRRCTELLSGTTMDELLHQLRIFDFVILDTPPMGMFAEAEALAAKVDATMLVVRQDTSPACDINDATDILRNASAKFMGVVLNDMTHSITEGYGYSYGYGYGYGYGRGYGYGYAERSSQKSKQRKGG